jgi:tetratricopeptide (TPR) repeat protein
MLTPLHVVLSPIRWRQRLQASLTAAVAGLLVTAVVGLGFGLWKFAAGQPAPWWATVGIVLAGPLFGAAVGFFRRRAWHDAAAAVDARYALKDRTVTALEFLARPANDGFHDLQVSEALSRLQTVDARKVVPFALPRWTRWACLSAVAAVALLAWPFSPQELNANVERPPGIADAAAAIAQEIEHLKQMANEENREDLEELVAELEQDLEVLEKPETDVREALATISEMQAELAEQLKQYNTAVVDAQMHALAEALSSAEAFNAAARELKEGDYNEAAEELQKLEKVDLDRKESRATSEQLQKVAAAMKNAGLKDLSDATEQLSESVKESDSDKIGECTKCLAGQCKQQALRKSLSALLGQKLNRLSECKSMCQGGQCKLCGGSCKGGQCNKNSLAKGPSPKSDSPKNTWGMGTHGNLDGDGTSLASTRTQEQATGELGDGPSEFETTSSPEGQESARRGYREAYGKYKKMSDAVLESEPIPLGQRQLIRNYFELIRPDREAEVFNEDSSAK